MSIEKCLVMTDWAAQVEGIAHDRNSLLWELILHSFLRDEVLIQDEALAQSERLADWFQSDEDFRILEELIDTEVFSVIVQPPDTYTDSHLQDIAHVAPLRAKRESILLKHGRRFDPSPSLKRFHNRMDYVIAEKGKKAIRHRPIDIHDAFGTILVNALTDSRYNKWFKRNFDIDARLRGALAEYVRHPSLILDRLKGRVAPKLDPKFSDHPVFTRNLGHQLAQTYSEAEEAGINALIHSAYARAVTMTHGTAAGRYNEYLRPLLPGAPPNGRKAKGLRIAEVGYDVPMTLRLPALSPGLCCQIQTVRMSKQYIDFRKSLRTAGQELTFQQQKDAWLGFADVLASKISNGRDVPMRTVLGHGLEVGGEHFATVAVFHVFALSVAVLASGVVRSLDPFSALEALGTTSLAVATAVGIPLLRSCAEQDDTRAELKRAVTFVARI